MHDRLDSLDKRLIALLQQNARTTATTLAKRLGVPRTTVASRIQRLEKTGVIQGYGVRLGTRVSAVRSICALQVEPKAGAAVVRRLTSMPEIEQLLAVSGNWDYMATIAVEHLAQLDRVLDAIGEIDGVRQRTSALLLATKLDRR